MLCVTISSTVSQEACVSANHAFIHSRLKYGIIFWGNSVQASRIFKLQKSCIRAVFHLKNRQSCKPIFKNENILTIPSLFIHECACFVKCNYDLVNSKELKHTYDTRGTVHKHLCPPQTTRTKVQKSTVTQVIRIYNRLPNKVKELPLRKFKSVLKKCLVNEAFYTTDDLFSVNFNVASL